MPCYFHLFATESHSTFLYLKELSRAPFYVLSARKSGGLKVGLANQSCRESSIFCTSEIYLFIRFYFFFFLGKTILYICQ